MKAPDKIYLNRIHPEPYWFNDKQVDSDIEYICKDALIEWLENKIKISDGGFVNGLVCLAYKDVIEHLNEM